jgi:hypothetical protein
VFRDCSSLSSICIPNCIEKLGSNCFYACGSLQPVTFETPSNLSRIESEAFYCCSSLLSICLPNRVEVLCSRCFRLCTSLRDVEFEKPSHVRTIESEAFRSCSSLSQLNQYDNRRLPALCPHRHRIKETWMNQKHR